MRCGGRLADAARPGKHERLRQPPARERVAQRTRHRVLPTTSSNVCGRHLRAMT
jgi:hypothetical protein